MKDEGHTDRHGRTAKDLARHGGSQGSLESLGSRVLGLGSGKNCEEALEVESLLSRLARVATFFSPALAHPSLEIMEVTRLMPISGKTKIKTKSKQIRTFAPVG